MEGGATSRRRGTIAPSRRGSCEWEGREPRQRWERHRGCVSGASPRLLLTQPPDGAPSEVVDRRLRKRRCRVLEVDG